MTNDKPLFLKNIFSALNPRRIVDASAEFLKLEAAGGIILVFVSILALITANSPLAGAYEHILNKTYFGIGVVEGFGIQKNILHWINDGLMALFFLLIGLEIKREILVGELTTRKKATLPILAAIGGMAVPAAIYAFINKDNPEFIAGWAIPCATDIAFALGILSLLGNRVPLSIKVLLLATAIIDDLGAIIIIAMFYTADLHINALLFSIIPIFCLFLLNRYSVWRIAPYMLFGLILWAAVLESGVHATLAGVITALFIPLRVPEERRSPSQRLEGDLHPWVIFIVMPIFAFANAGVPLDGMGLDSLLHPVTLGTILGLVIGKQVGVFATLWLAIKAGWGEKPAGAHWAQLYAVSILCGIGFTMSLFIGGLAFPEDAVTQSAVRLGVLAGSFLSAVAGYILLRITTDKV